MATSFIHVLFFMQSKDHLASNFPLLALRSLRDLLGLHRGRRRQITLCLGTRSPARAYSCLKGEMWKFWCPLVSFFSSVAI